MSIKSLQNCMYLVPFLRYLAPKEWSDLETECRSFKVIENGAVRQIIYDFRLVRHQQKSTQNGKKQQQWHKLRKFTQAYIFTQTIFCNKRLTTFLNNNASLVDQLCTTVIYYINIIYVIVFDCSSKWPYILSSFDEAAYTMGLNTSWSKTKIQNLGHGVTPAVQCNYKVTSQSPQTVSHILAVISTRLSVPPQRYSGVSVQLQIYFRQTRQHLEADKIEFTDKDTALQCPCHLRTVIWL